MFGQFEKSVYLCTRKSDNEELNGSVAQLNRASDYGSEGCGFESRGSHKRKKPRRKFTFSFGFFLLCYSARGREGMDDVNPAGLTKEEEGVSK